MRRVMKNVEYTKSDVVLYPTPFFNALLRQRVRKNYTDVLKIKPNAVSHIIAALYHPDYGYGGIMGSSKNNYLSFQSCLTTDPRYIVDRINNCVERFHHYGVTDITATDVLSMLENIHGDYLELMKDMDFHNTTTYTRDCSTGTVYVTIPATLCKNNKYDIIRNQSGAKKSKMWYPITTQELMERKIPIFVLSNPLYYFFFNESGVVKNPVYTQTDWSILGKFIN